MICANCAASLAYDHARDPAFGVCAGCHRVRYCCPACQLDAWCGLFCVVKLHFQRVVEVTLRLQDTDDTLAASQAGAQKGMQAGAQGARSRGYCSWR